MLISISVHEKIFGNSFIVNRRFRLLQWCTLKLSMNGSQRNRVLFFAHPTSPFPLKTLCFCCPPKVQNTPHRRSRLSVRLTSHSTSSFERSCFLKKLHNKFCRGSFGTFMKLHCSP